MKKYLFTGIIILLPLTLTILIISFVVNFLTKPFMGIVSHFLIKTDVVNRGFCILSPEQTLRYGSQLIILVCLFLVILSIGMIARWYLFRSAIHLGEKILHRLPLINKVYKTTKDIITHLFGDKKDSFKQVVLVPFPAKGIYVMGLLSQPAPSLCNRSANAKMASVFIPTAPNPTTGFTIMYKLEDIQCIDMRIEDAIRYIVSCGVVTPPDIHTGDNH